MGNLLSPYVVLFLIVLILLAITRAIPALSKKSYLICMIVMTLFLALRYGQGTDYSAYEWFYLMAPSSLDFTNLYFTDTYHSEFLWKLLMVVLKMVGIPFKVFIGALSCLMMWCLYRFIKKFSPDPMLSTLIAFPTLYLVYFFSGIREGLVVAVFLGYMIEMLLSGKRLQYVCLSIFLGFFHTVAFFFILILLIADHKPAFKLYFYVLPLCAILGLAPLLSSSFLSFYQNLPFVGVYFKEAYGGSAISYAALGSRVLLFLIVFLGAMQCLKTSSQDNQNVKLLSFCLDIYIVGFCLYLILMVAPIAASRFFLPFQSLAIILIPLIFSIKKKWKNAITVFIVIFSFVFLVKNLNAFLIENNYYDYLSWWSYPYVSVFDDPSVLSSYRQITKFGLP